MKLVVPALVLAGGLAFADGEGTKALPDKPKADEPKGNPNKAEPGLAEQGWKAYETTYVPVKDWSTRGMPGPLQSVGSKGGAQVLALPVKDRDGVSVKTEEFAIEVDANHDGKMDDRLKSDGATCLVNLIYDDGTSAPYCVRFQKGGGGAWRWQRSGYWVATVNKAQIGIIDNNNNGIYDENGKDAITVGLTGYATPISEIVNLGGALYRLKIEANGRKIWVKEYDGEAGKLDVRSGHKSLGVLASAVFQNGQTWIDFAALKDKAALVPAGTWTFVGGETKAASGGQAAMMGPGKMAPVEVKKDETTKVAWGMDLKIDFDFNVVGGNVSIEASSVHVYGTAQEEYLSFVPPSFTPVVQVTNAKTGDQAQKGKMSLC